MNGQTSSPASLTSTRAEVRALIKETIHQSHTAASSLFFSCITSSAVHLLQKRKTTARECARPSLRTRQSSSESFSTDQDMESLCILVYPEAYAGFLLAIGAAISQGCQTCSRFSDLSTLPEHREMRDKTTHELGRERSASSRYIP